MIKNPSARKPIYVLYGSQTGNSESIAMDIHDHLSKYDILSKCISLNEATKKPLRDIALAVVIVCATTGNGDSPDNADKFWRTIKKRSIPKDHFAGLPFSVLALGDTNYDKFCHMGKSIEKRIHELGGMRLLDLHCADEATSLEEVVEAWKSSVLEILLPLASDESESKVLGGNDGKRVVSDKCDVSETSCENSSIVPFGVATLHDVCDIMGVTLASIHLPPDDSMLLKKRMISENCCEILQGDSSAMWTEHESRSSGEYDISNPFHGSVREVCRLTNHFHDAVEEWEDCRDVLRLELDITGSNIQYQPGDYLAIMAPNPCKCVNIVIQRLNKSSSSAHENVFSNVISGDTKIRKGDEILTLQELFQYRLDLVGVPRKPVVFALSQYCSDENESNAMKWLCAKGDIGKALWTNFVELQCLGVAEILAFFPSCCPPIHVLVALLSPLSPRPYSIASSQLVHPTSVVIAFSIVRYCCGIGLQPKLSDKKKYNIHRSGMCTSYLEKVLQPSLESGCVLGHVTLRVIWKPSIAFRMPGNVSTPLLLIGPGTGVAPFIGFLEHRGESEKDRSQSGEDTSSGLWRGGFELDEGCKLPYEGNAIDNFLLHVNPGPIYLFYGCRNHSDWIFKETMNMYLSDGTLTGLDVAFSRESSEKEYVTHKLLAKGDEISKLILNCNAHIYICGDGNKMAKDVLNCLATILYIHGELSEVDANEMLDEMRNRRRLMMDVWS